MHSTCFAHIVFFVLVTIIPYGEEYDYEAPQYIFSTLLLLHF